MSKIDTAVKVGTKAGIYALQGLVVAGGISAGAFAGIAWEESKIRKEMLKACSNANTKAEAMLSTGTKINVKLCDIMVPVSAAGLSMLGSTFFISTFYELGKLAAPTIIKIIK